jgi:competence protein ComEC
MVAAALRAMVWPRFGPRFGAPRMAWLAGLGTLLRHEQLQLPLWLPVALGGGVVAYFVPLAEPPAWLGAALLGLAAALLALCWRAPQLRLPAGLVLAASLGFADIQHRAASAPPVPELSSRAVLLDARVVAVEPLPEGRRLVLEGAAWDGHAPLARTIRLRLRANDATPVAAGDRITVRALLRPPAAPAEPGAFDFQRAAFFAGQAGSGFALAPVQVTQHEAAPDTWIAALRGSIIARVRAAQPAAESAISVALLAGPQTAIGQADAQAMRDSGLAHLLSVSGLHIAIVMGVTYASLRFLLALWPALALRLPVKQLALVSGLAAGGFYMLLTGTEVPMQRSFGMAALVTLAVLAGRNPISLRTLALAAGAILLLLPHALVGASFQMSFAAVLALIAGFEALRPWLLRARRDDGVLRKLLLATLALLLTSTLAGIATAPFALYHFQRASLYGVLANAVAVPLTSFFVMPLGMLALLLMPLGLDFLALVPMGWGVAGVLWVAHAVAAMPAAALALPAMPQWGLWLCVAGLLWMGLWRTWLRWLGAPLFALGMVSPAWHVPPDVLVSADARVIAVRHQGAVHVLRGSGGNGFVLDTWRRRAGEPEIVPMHCAPPFCVLDQVAVVPAGPLPPGACGAAPLLVSPEPLRRFCRQSLTIDRFDVWRNGPHAVWFTADGPVMLSDRAARGARPWVPPRPRSRGSDPPAQTE